MRKKLWVASLLRLSHRDWDTQNGESEKERWKEITGVGGHTLFVWFLLFLTIIIGFFLFSLRVLEGFGKGVWRMKDGRWFFLVDIPPSEHNDWNSTTFFCSVKVSSFALYVTCTLGMHAEWACWMKVQTSRSRSAYATIVQWPVGETSLHS